MSLSKFVGFVFLQTLQPGQSQELSTLQPVGSEVGIAVSVLGTVFSRRVSQGQNFSLAAPTVQITGGEAVVMVADGHRSLAERSDSRSGEDDDCGSISLLQVTWFNCSLRDWGPLQTESNLRMHEDASVKLISIWLCNQEAALAGDAVLRVSFSLPSTIGTTQGRPPTCIFFDETVKAWSGDDIHTELELVNTGAASRMVVRQVTCISSRGLGWYSVLTHAAEVVSVAEPNRASAPEVRTERLLLLWAPSFAAATMALICVCSCCVLVGRSRCKARKGKSRIAASDKGQISGKFAGMEPFQEVCHRPLRDVAVVVRASPEHVGFARSDAVQEQALMASNSLRQAGTGDADERWQQQPICKNGDRMTGAADLSRTRKESLFLPPPLTDSLQNHHKQQ